MAARMVHATSIVVPFKGRRGAKSRLAPMMSASQREELAFAMADHVLGVCAETALRLIVVTACPAARKLAAEHGAETIDDVLESGTSAAYREALTRLDARQPNLLINADLPLLQRADIEAMLAVPDKVAIAPDRRLSGTNALYIPADTSFELEFGSGSFSRHKRNACATGIPWRIVSRASLAADVDEPEDLDVVSPQMTSRALQAELIS